MGCTCRAIPRLSASQVLMASTYPANVAQAVQWSTITHLNKAMLLFRRYLTSPGRQRQITGGLSTVDGIDGRKPQWVQNLGDAFLAQPQDVMDRYSDCGNWRNKPAR